MPKAGARVMDLQDPTSKMSKSTDSDAGCICMLDDPAVDREEVQAGGDRHRQRGALRPGGQAGRVEPARHPRRRHGLDAEELAGKYTQYGPLKADTGEAVVELLRPIQARYRELMTDRGELASLLRRAPTRPACGRCGDARAGLRRDRLAPALTGIDGAASDCCRPRASGDAAGPSPRDEVDGDRGDDRPLPASSAPMRSWS